MIFRVTATLDLPKNAHYTRYNDFLVQWLIVHFSSNNCSKLARKIRQWKRDRNVDIIQGSGDCSIQNKEFLMCNNTNSKNSNSNMLSLLLFLVITVFVILLLALQSSAPCIMQFFGGIKLSRAVGVSIFSAVSKFSACTNNPWPWHSSQIIEWVELVENWLVFSL